MRFLARVYARALSLVGGPMNHPSVRPAFVARVLFLAAAAYVVAAAIILRP
jgi:hypothetical protein